MAIERADSLFNFFASPLEPFQEKIPSKIEIATFGHFSRIKGIDSRVFGFDDYITVRHSDPLEAARKIIHSLVKAGSVNVASAKEVPAGKRKPYVYSSQIKRFATEAEADPFYQKGLKKRYLEPSNQ